jgi:hypothetical protein
MHVCMYVHMHVSMYEYICGLLRPRSKAAFNSPARPRSGSVEACAAARHSVCDYLLGVGTYDMRD